MLPLLLSKLVTPKNIAIAAWIGVIAALWIRGNYYNGKYEKEKTTVNTLTQAIKDGQREREILAKKIEIASKLAESINKEHQAEAKKILSEPLPTNPEDSKKYLDDLLKRVK